MIRAWITIELTNGSVIKYVRDLLNDTSTGAIQSISVASGGTGYTTANINNVVSITGGSGNARAAITGVSPQGVVTSVNLMVEGSGYSTASGVATSGGGGSGLTLNVVIVPGAGAITTLAVVSGGSGYATGNVVSLNTNGSLCYGARATVTGSGAVTSAVITSSGNGYTVGSVFSTTALSGSGSGCILRVTGVSSGLGTPRQFYCYDGDVHNFSTETAVGQIQGDFNSLITAMGTANKFLAYPDNYTSIPANTVPTVNSYQPMQRGLVNYNYIMSSQVVRIFVTQEWFDGSGMGILPSYVDTTFAGIDGPTYQQFS